jgi:hypothetical protein
VPTFADRGYTVVSATDPTAVFSLSRPEPVIFFQVSPQLDPVPDKLLLRKSAGAVNRTRTSGSVVRNSDH